MDAVFDSPTGSPQTCAAAVAKKKKSPPAFLSDGALTLEETLSWEQSSIYTSESLFILTDPRGKKLFDLWLAILAFSLKGSATHNKLNPYDCQV